MKLYFSPGVCSLAPHITLREAGLPFELEKVDFQTKKTQNGGELGKVNPKGMVPALVLDNGEVLTEGPVIMQYLADRKPEAKLVPPAGTLERYRVQEWLNFITSELHKGFGPLFRPTTPPEYKTIAQNILEERISYVEGKMDGKQYLMGDQFTVADAYLFTVLGWTKFVGMKLDKWPKLQAYVGRVAGRPAVQEALKAEGLA